MLDTDNQLFISSISRLKEKEDNEVPLPSISYLEGHTEQKPIESKRMKKHKKEKKKGKTTKKRN